MPVILPGKYLICPACHHEPLAELPGGTGYECPKCKWIFHKEELLRKVKIALGTKKGKPEISGSNFNKRRKSYVNSQERHEPM